MKFKRDYLIGVEDVGKNNKITNGRNFIRKSPRKNRQRIITEFLSIIYNKIKGGKEKNRVVRLL